MRMGMIVATVGDAALGVVGVRALVGPGTHGRALLRRSGDRVARNARHLADRWHGVRYRARGRHPDPTASGAVLADRISSSLGPVEARMDLPHVHVMAEDHNALLHGDVATAEQAHQLEAAVAAVSGVEGVESYLHVGLLPGDTRPSDGAHHRPPSAALRQLAVESAEPVIAAVLATLHMLVPEEVAHIGAVLPHDLAPFWKEGRAS